MLNSVSSGAPAPVSLPATELSADINGAAGSRGMSSPPAPPPLGQLNIAPNRSWCRYFLLPFSLSGSRGSDSRNPVPCCYSEVEADGTGLADAVVTGEGPAERDSAVPTAVLGMERGPLLLGRVCTSVRTKKRPGNQWG